MDACPHSILLELFSNRGSGTAFTAAATANKHGAGAVQAEIKNDNNSKKAFASIFLARKRETARFFQPQEGTPMDSEKVIKRDGEYVLHTYNRNPIALEKGRGLYADQARRDRNTLILPAASG